MQLRKQKLGYYKFWNETLDRKISWSNVPKEVQIRSKLLETIACVEEEKMQWAEPDVSFLRVALYSFNPQF